jgi:hypothetical protein
MRIPGPPFGRVQSESIYQRHNKMHWPQLDERYVDEFGPGSLRRIGWSEDLAQVWRWRRMLSSLDVTPATVPPAILKFIRRVAKSVA